MAEGSKRLVTKKLVENALDFGDKTREKAKELQTFDLSYFVGKSYFDNDGTKLLNISTSF